jgi:hypothetical protein
VLPGVPAGDLPGGVLQLPRERLGQEPRANYYREFQSLFEQLQGASREELARIMAAVGGPTLVPRLGAGFAHLNGR